MLGRYTVEKAIALTSVAGVAAAVYGVHWQKVYERKVWCGRLPRLSQIIHPSFRLCDVDRSWTLVLIPFLLERMDG